MNKFPIDVVIPWLNPTTKWKDEYSKYCEDEDPCRIRDLNTIRPTLRGVIKNLPFVRLIWVIVFDEEQITSANYPELSDPKIRIVYHRDIIPQEFLPNFNSLLIPMYMHKIPEIADNIIFMNDDMIYNKEMSADIYFVDDKPVHHPTLRPGKRGPDHKVLWGTILYSTQKLFDKITNRNDRVCDNWHMPCPLSKDTLEYVHTYFETDLYNSCKNAKIRRPYSISVVELTYWLDEALNHFVSKNVYDKVKRKFLVLKDSTTDKEIEESKSFDITCVNDSEDLINDSERIAKTIERVFSE